MKGIAKILQGKDIKVTAQRAAVLEFLQGNEDHPSPEEVFRKVKQRFPYISRATVYNTIKALTKAGVLREVLVEQEKTRVDPNVSPHHHFKCVRCGKIEDMPYGLLTVNQVAGRVQGYQVRDVHVILKGLCRKCG
jgi:Fur family peroxide stress response transcriptional regulator